MDSMIKTILRLAYYGPLFLISSFVKRISKYNVLQLRIRGGYPEVARYSPLRIFQKEKTDYFTLCRRLSIAADDPKIEAVVVTLGANKLGLARTQEVGRLIGKLTKNGKKTIAVIEGGGTREYYLAAQCEKIVITPPAALFLNGLSIETLFVGELLERYDVKPDFLAEGKYKSAAEVLTRKNPSRYSKQMLRDLVRDLNNEMIAGIAKGRNIKEDKVRQWIDDGPYTAQEAKKVRIAHEVAYSDQVNKDLKKELGKKQSISAAAHYKWAERHIRYTKILRGRGLVAILNAAGNIVEKTPQQGAVQISPGPFIKTIKALRQDKEIKAVVLRVSSPGGSALASDLIHHELQQLAKAKPLIVSIGDMAASGGYYLSMAGARIFSEGAAVTGSIGVISGKVSLKEFYNRFGVYKEIFAEGDNAAMMSDYGTFSESERRKLKSINSHFYKEFKAKVAKSRNLTAKKVEDAAQGRVFSGAEAMKLGLADEIGGLEDAVRAAGKKAGLPAGEYPLVTRVNPARVSWLKLPRWAAALGVENTAITRIQKLFDLHESLRGRPSYLIPFIFDIDDTDSW